MTTRDAGNREAIEAWDTILFEKFSRFRPVLTGGLARHGDAAIRRLALPTGARVLDLGCGFGDTSVALARAVGPAGRVVGVDAAARFIEVARAEASAAGSTGNLEFVVADVESEPLGGPYDIAFSRFGTMFFASPVHALRNIHRSLVRGGRLAMVVWRRREDNEWVHLAERVTRELVPDHRDPDALTCGPGPFSMADADVVSSQLVAAGFLEVTLERHDAAICIGHTLEEAIDFALALGPAGEMIRLAGDEGERARPALRAALADAFAPLADDRGQVHAAASTWLVGATAW